MDREDTVRFDVDATPSPCYLCDRDQLNRNLDILDAVQKRSGCTILLALKAFAMFSTFPQLRDRLGGATASSLNEAQLAHDALGREVHTYAPAYRDDEFADLVRCADHMVFNSFSQWRRFRDRRELQQKSVRCGLRINPQLSTVETPLYDPCYRHSRLGIVDAEFIRDDLDRISGLHFHTHCGSNADALERTLTAVESRFGDVIRSMDWINFGGGHHITRDDYDVDLLCRLVSDFADRYQVTVYLEPGEAVALNAGYLVATVLDIVRNEIDIAILDTSATTHMPDVLEMPYRPDIIGASEPGTLPHTYRLAGLTCLAGDIIGDYAFSQPLTVGTRVVFTDMLHYTMVKNTTFNGVNLPAIATWSEAAGLEIIRTFGYEDFKSRLS